MTTDDDDDDDDDVDVDDDDDDDDDDYDDDDDDDDDDDYSDESRIKYFPPDQIYFYLMIKSSITLCNDGTISVF